MTLRKVRGGSPLHVYEDSYPASKVGRIPGIDSETLKPNSVTVATGKEAVAKCVFLRSSIPRWLLPCLFPLLLRVHSHYD